MKRLFALLAAIVSLITGCGNSGSISALGIDASVILGAEYTHNARTEQIPLSDAEKTALSEWLSGLKFEHRSYPDGEAPGDSDGGEAYVFTLSGDELTYVNNGGDERFLLYSGEWYALIDPEELPILS